MVSAMQFFGSIEARPLFDATHWLTFLQCTFGLPLKTD